MFVAAREFEQLAVEQADDVVAPDQADGLVADDREHVALETAHDLAGVAGRPFGPRLDRVPFARHMAERLRVPLDPALPRERALVRWIGAVADLDADPGTGLARFGQRHRRIFAERQQMLDALDDVVRSPRFGAGRPDPEVKPAAVGHAVRGGGWLRAPYIEIAKAGSSRGLRGARAVIMWLGE